jgi:hypothetical protein
MAESEVTGENRAGIAENQVCPSIKDPLLVFREMLQTEEARPFTGFCFVCSRKSVLDSFLVVLESDRKSSASDFPFPDSPQRIAPPPEVSPNLPLRRQQVMAKDRKPLSPLLPIENCIGFFFKKGDETLFFIGPDVHPRIPLHSPRIILWRARISSVRI